MPPPILNYSATRPPRRWIAKTVTALMLMFGLSQLGLGLYTLYSPGNHTAYDMKIVLYNAWVRVLLGAVLTVPAACLATGLVRDEPLPEPPPDG